MINIDLRVLNIDGTLADIESKHLGFGYGNGDRLAKSYQEVARPWKGDQHVALRQLNESRQFDCIHSVYGASMQFLTFSWSFITAHGLFCLAAHLKKHPRPELATFTGIIYGFGSSKLAEVVDKGSPWPARDLKVPVLYLMNGRPASIYSRWHTDQVAEDDNALFAFSGEDASLTPHCLVQEAVEA